VPNTSGSEGDVVQRMMRGNRVLLVGLAALAVVAGLAAGRPGLAAVPTIRPAAGPPAGGSCDAFAQAYQLSGAYGVTPAAWSGHGLTVPACGPIPNNGGSRGHVHPYPGALWTPGYQCVEFSERYLYYRYGVTMGISTDGDQVAAHYAAAYPSRFMVVPNGTPGRAPVAGDVLSMSKARGFDGADGGHTAVVQASSVNAAGAGTVTIVEENAVASGVQVLPVSGWSVRYDGFPYLEWLTAAGLLVTTPTLAAAQVSRAYSARLTAGGGPGPYHWAVTAGSLPEGLALSASGVLAGTVSAASGGGGDAIRTWPFTVTVTDAKHSVALAELNLTVTGAPEIFSYAAAAGSLRDARWTGTGWAFTTVDGAGSARPGHTSDDVGAASSAVESGGQPMVFYSDTTTGALRFAWRSGPRWGFKTLDGPGSTLAGHTGDQVGMVVSAVVVAGEPQVYYLDATSGSVRYASRTAAGWRLVTLDGPGSAFPQHTGHHVGSAISALAVDGQPQVYYYDATAGTMHRAWWNGTRWLFLTIDGSASLLAGHTADQVGSAIAATLSGDRPQVFYADATRQSLRYAWLTATGWRFATLDGSASQLAGHTADHVGAAIGVTQMNGGAQVYYSDATRQSLRHAWLTDSGWQLETLDGAGSMITGHDADHDGSALSVTTTATGPQVFYADATRGSLRHAWWTSTGWNFEIVDGPGSTLPGHTADPVGASVSATLF
jgi:Putative Ig domain